MTKLLSRQEVEVIQKKVPVPEELVSTFNEWIIRNLICGKCSVSKQKLLRDLNCFESQFRSLLYQLQSEGWVITNTDETLEFS